MNDFERVQRDYGLDDDEIFALFPDYYVEHKYPSWSPKETSSDNRPSSEDHDDADNCTATIRNGMSREERVKAANKFGPNWANIISGLGDQ
jgi:hypothetical protein